MNKVLSTLALSSLIASSAFAKDVGEVTTNFSVFSGTVENCKKSYVKLKDVPPSFAANKIADAYVEGWFNDTGIKDISTLLKGSETFASGESYETSRDFIKQEVNNVKLSFTSTTTALDYLTKTSMELQIFNQKGKSEFTYNSFLTQTEMDVYITCNGQKNMIVTFISFHSK